MKKLYDISWRVDEPIYRADDALSYSTIARFAREGFNKLDNLFTEIDTPSLTFGKAVDAIITGGQEEFEKDFMVADFPSITDSVLKVVKEAFSRWGTNYRSLDEIPSQELMELTKELQYQLNWKPETRVKVIREQGNEYYKLMAIASNRKILNVETYNSVLDAVKALKTSEATKHYFNDNQFDTRYSREYQLKFKAAFNGVDYRCMADLCVVDYEKKIVYPVDLKTSSHAEWDFYESFIQWRYDIQGRLYWRIIRYNMDRDEFFKDFELADYTFIVVNRNTLTPLVWKFEDTKARGTLKYGHNKDIELRDPTDLGSELHYYLSSRPAVPTGIVLNGYNSIKEWLNEK